MKWTLDTSHSAAEFSVKHLMISTVRGRFKTFTGTGETGADGALKAVEMELDAASIDTNEAKRDAHLRSADFFDAEKFPKIFFRSSHIEQKGDSVTLNGSLTMHGVTKPVTLKGEFSTPVTDPWGNSRAALEVSTKINRKEWGLVWNMALEAGGLMVAEDVKISVEAEAVAVKEGAAAAA